MPLASDVDLREIAEHSHGFVGADLEALGQEVGLIALRRFLATTPLDMDAATSADVSGLHVTRDDFLAGLKEVEPSATREFFIEKSATTFGSLAGLDRAKQLLHAVIEHSHVHDDLYEKVGLNPPRGILLTGPSGTGKTAMARALSGEMEIPLIAIDGPQLYSKWLGESERALREVFKKARRAAPCILFFDTIDAIAPKFGSEQFGNDVYQRILSQLLREIDNLRDVKGVILLAASNREERIEPALLRSGRFDYVVPFAVPDAAERAAILRLCCRQVPLAVDVDFQELADRTEGFTGADIESWCKKATLLAIVEFQDGARSRAFHRFAQRFPERFGFRSRRSQADRKDHSNTYHRRDLCPDAPQEQLRGSSMSYTELTVWTRGIIMDKEGRDIVNSISAAARIEGKYSQAMENYVDNPDRTNCPTRKYCRVSDTVIENALTYENDNPNIVVLVEGTMVKGWDYMRGMPPGGTLVINTHYTPDYMMRFVPGPERLAQLVCVDAAKLADHKWLYYRLGELGSGPSFHRRRGRAQQAGRTRYCRAADRSRGEDDGNRENGND